MPRGKRKNVDVLSENDYKIFELGSKNANYISDYYLRTPKGGTYWRKEQNPRDEEKEAAWKLMFDIWIRNKSEPIWEYNGIEYTIIYENDSEYPTFWHKHGWLFQPWQLELYHCPQPEVTCVAGYGSGKTALEAAAACILAMTIPRARIFCVAPQMIQTMEVFRYITTNFVNTPFWDRFVVSYPTKPYPIITVANDYIGESTIEFYSIERDPEKVRTLEGDIVFLDQAEKIENLDEVLQIAGSRLRGMTDGRPKLGKFVMFANAGDNPQLWYRFDMDKEMPETFKSFEIASWTNPYLSKKDIENMKRRVGGTQDQIDQWMGGKRPMGSGKHFSAETVRLCTDDTLDRIMNNAIEAKISGFIRKTGPKVGVFHWEMPPDFDGGRNYCVIGDPGQGDPPERNSPPIMVWDITEFPKNPAFLRAFVWVFGRGSYWPFLYEYERLVKQYRAHGRNGFDSTGVQKGFDELVFSMMDLHPAGMSMAGTGKMLALNAAKLYMGKGLMKFPYIPHLANQLTNYSLPDEKIRQDLVMAICMSASYMRRLYYEEAAIDENGLEAATDFDDRYKREDFRRYYRENYSRS